MLPAAARLRRRSDFVATVRRGRRRGYGAVVVHVRLAEPNDQTNADAQVRVGFVVSRAVGGAVARNRVRRRLQHVVHDRLGSLPAGATLVVRALPDAASRSYPELAGDFDSALHGALSQRRRGGGSRQRRIAGKSAEPKSGAGDAPGDQPVRGLAHLTPARLLAAPILAYRRWVSPALPARCRFYPSCSSYALTALQTHGAVRGTLLTIWRLLRCQPFHPGGYDPVPPAPRRRPRATVTGASTCSTG